MKTTRKQFLVAVSTAVAPLVVPGRVFGANSRINVGWIGCGRRAGQLQGIPEDAQAVAFADVNIKRAQSWLKFGRKYGMAKDDCYQDYREMLERDDLDAVIIATPDHWHALNSIHAMNAGKHVYCEKPMTLTIREGRLMVNAARKNNVVCQCGSQQRTMEQNRIGCALVREGRIGKVHTVHAACFPTSWECDLPEMDAAPEEIDWDMWCGPTKPRGYHDKLYVPRGGKMGHEWGWISFRRYSGGEMTGWGAHGFDQIQWALGKDLTGPTKIIAHDESPPFDGVHLGPNNYIDMVYEDGTVMKIDGKAGGGGGWFEGEDGEVKIDRGKYACKPDTLDDEMPSLPASSHTGDTNEHIANWLHCARTGERPNADVEIGHRSSTVCHLGNIARWLKRELTWDPVTETFPGDDEANSYIDRDRRAPWVLES
jgi:predicted dehydrogenase